MNSIDVFVASWCSNNDMTPIQIEDVVHLESTLNIQLPVSYKYLITNYGLVHSPNVLTKVCDLTVSFSQVQDFLSLDDINSLSKLYEMSGMPVGYILFASDCKGNMFCFKRSDCVENKTDCAVWFYHYEQGTVTKVADSFVVWLEQFNTI